MHKELDWDSAIAKKIRIYRNLNNGHMSVQQKVDKRWAVVGHVTDCVVRDVRFHISEAGRQRVIREGCKNVHAWGEGILMGQLEPDLYAPILLVYNPYVHTSFIEQGDDSVRIDSCRYLVVRANVVYVSRSATVHAAKVVQTGKPVIVQPALFFATG